MHSKLAIFYHAPSDNVRRIVDALIDGASDPAIESVDVCPVQALAAGPAELQEADGVIFATTENFGYMSGALKDFFDRSYYPCLDKVDGKPYALVVKAGNDGTGTVNAVTRIVTGLKLKQVAEPLLMVGNFQEIWLGQCRELGMTLAAGLEAGIF
ncbi:flavodoxin family protein [Candidatus Rariloculus sp.]|uniref:flavodoxin family protein n=1 Tax=Candidatus Rariloculus sp. TaxID=3101265 RepID=UPI003D09C806